VLLVSQFTLLAQIKKGKPDFRGAADANKARQLYDYFYSKVRDLYTPDRVKNGVFQAMMEVGLVNDGPVGVDYRSDDGAVTLEIDTNPPKKQGEDTGSEPNSELSKDPKDLNQEEPLNSRDQVQQIEFQLPTSLLE
jgi:D-tyrosyl-tRNA(Tyr) deacylase